MPTSESKLSYMNLDNQPLRIADAYTIALFLDGLTTTLLSSKPALICAILSSFMYMVVVPHGLG